ncbi:MAG: tripartite tricarboxylate transporter permease [Deltaproteobacteria bacterium]|nr:tripartite tricarboxylate transporter permease [Deltaproteobacteria bacterium]
MTDIPIAAFQGFISLLSWPIFPVMMLGIFMGMFIGIVPGLGGLIGMAMLLPFAIGKSPEVAFAFLLGMYAVTTQTDTIPAVLLGVPGTVSAAATGLDGYPLAQRGEAGRALSASYLANIVGAIIAALVFIAFLPFLRKLMLLFASPEFFMLTMLGIVMIGSLTGDFIQRGLIMGAVGLILAMIGLSPNTGEPRFVFNITYLWDGIPFVPLVLGLFAIPESVDLMVSQTTIAHKKIDATKGKYEGFADVIRHKWLVIKCSLIGTFCGAVPGLGGPVAEWFGYAHAVQTAKDPSTFGKGDIRGVIAPESATAGQKPGSLIPTVTFGIPGNPAMALLLGYFLIIGLQPGPEMLTTKLNLTFLMIWTIVLGNIIAAILILLLQPYLIRMCYIRANMIVPLMLGFMVVGASIATKNIGDVVSFGVFGLAGYIFKHTGWPRVPLIMGLVLGQLAEPYLFITIDRYGAAFLWGRPIPPIVLALMALSVALPIYRKKKHNSSNILQKTVVNNGRKSIKAWRDVNWWIGVFFTLIAILVICISKEFSFRGKLFPWVVGIPLIFIGILHTFQGLFPRFQARRTYIEKKTISDSLGGSMDDVFRALLWVIILLISVILMGHKVGVSLFVFIYLLAHKEKAWLGLITATATWIFISVVIERTMNISFFEPVLFRWIGL